MLLTDLVNEIMNGDYMSCCFNECESIKENKIRITPKNVHFLFVLFGKRLLSGLDA